MAGIPGNLFGGPVEKQIFPIPEHRPQGQVFHDIAQAPFAFPEQAVGLFAVADVHGREHQARVKVVGFYLGRTQQQIKRRAVFPDPTRLHRPQAPVPDIGVLFAAHALVFLV